MSNLGEPAPSVAMRSHVHEFTLCSTDSELSLCPLILVGIGFVQSQKVPIHGSTFPHLDHTRLGSGNCINILDRPNSILHHVEMLDLFLRQATSFKHIPTTRSDLFRLQAAEF